MERALQQKFVSIQAPNEEIAQPGKPEAIAALVVPTEVTWLYTAEKLVDFVLEVRNVLIYHWYYALPSLVI